MIGKSISHYRVVEKLGGGGMGEVYRSRDTRLNRDVALKVLPEVYARDAERMARFEREAQLLASLNHPNIAILHGLEESEGVRALVMELVEGPTLAERIAAGPIPVEEALPIARQIAEALEAAHEKGIVHRDLKPANVKVTSEGKVKVLDFGLAKAFTDESPGADPARSPTLTAADTRQGVILGTPAYMSPEQARGKPLDKRTDIWSFGCVVYEALTGHPAFARETISDTIANVLQHEPGWDALPAATPPNIRVLLRRCLQKDRDRRLHDVADARIEIDEAPRQWAKGEGPRASAPLAGRRSGLAAPMGSSHCGSSPPMGARLRSLRLLNRCCRPGIPLSLPTAIRLYTQRESSNTISYSVLMSALAKHASSPFLRTISLMLAGLRMAAGSFTPPTPVDTFSSGKCRRQGARPNG